MSSAQSHAAEDPGLGGYSFVLGVLVYIFKTVQLLVPKECQDYFIPSDWEWMSCHGGESEAGEVQHFPSDSSEPCISGNHTGFPKGLESWVQVQLKMVSMCVLSHCLGFLDSHSHTGKLLTFSGESQLLQHNFC